MKYHKLLNGYGGAIDLIPPFNMREMSKVDQSDPYLDECLYKKYDMGTNKLSPVAEIERAISRLVTAETHPEYKGFGGYGFAENGDFYCDYYDGSATEFAIAADSDEDFTRNRHTVLCIKENGGSLAMYGTCVDEYGAQTEYMVNERGQKDPLRKSGSAAIYALLAYTIAHFRKGKQDGYFVAKPIYDHYGDIVNSIDNGNFPLLYKANLSLDADIYTLLQYPVDLATQIYTFAAPSPLSLLPFEPEDFNYTEMKGMVDILSIPELSDVVGTSEILKGTAAEAGGISVEVPVKGETVGNLVNAKKFNLEIPFSDEEKELIPKGFDNFVCDPIVLDTANEIYESRFDPRPCRNIIWTGESGTGKTTSAMMLATILQLPYYSMNLSSDKLSSDILTSCLPNNRKVTEKDVEELISSFPSDFEIQMDAEGSYERITGTKKPGADENDVRKAMAKRLVDMSNRASDFMYVDSPFVKAYRNGGLVELQECNSAKAQILKALNEALDDTAVIHLPTGEVVHRNENCVVVVTANIGAGYRGVEDFSNDFLARMDQHDRFELPDDTELVERVVDRSGYENRENIRKMISAMKAIQKVLLEIRGDYGSCSPRALYSWARKTKNCGKPYYAGLKTIVGLATQDPEEEVELIAQLEQYFKKSDKA